MQVTEQLDLEVFGDNREWVEAYLEKIDLFFAREAYKALTDLQKIVDKMFSSKGVLGNDFMLSHEFEGDAGIESAAYLEYMRELGDSGCVYLTEISENHLMITY